MRTVVMNLDSLVAERIAAQMDSATNDQGNDQPPPQSRQVANNQRTRRNVTQSSNTTSSTSEARAALARMSERFNSQN